MARMLLARGKERKVAGLLLSKTTSAVDSAPVGQLLDCVEVGTNTYI